MKKYGANDSRKNKKTKIKKNEKIGEGYFYLAKIQILMVKIFF